MSALLVCAAVKISIAILSKLIADCDQLKLQVEAGRQSGLWSCCLTDRRVLARASSWSPRGTALE